MLSSRCTLWRTSIVVFAFHANTWAYGQGEILNGSFEFGSMPTAWAQSRFIDSWTSRSTLYEPQANGAWGHSPDYFDNGMIFNTSAEPLEGMRTGVAPLNITAHTGARFLGMDNYELIQQEYHDNNLQERRYYTISMWIRPSSYYFDGTNTLKVILSNNRLNYANSNDVFEFDNCTEDFRTITNASNARTVGSWSVNLQDYPSDVWTRIAATFYVDEDVNESYGWFNISTENPAECGGGNTCS